MAIRCSNGIPAAIWRAGTKAIWCPAAPPCSASICISARISAFWINLGIQALATLWILQLTLRVLGMAQPLRLLAISLVLILTTALPWLASMLLTDIFAGLSVLSLFILVAAWRARPRRSKNARCSSSPLSPRRRTAPRWRCCSGCAASAGSRGRFCAGGLPLPDWRRAASPSSPAPRCCCRRISRCRDNWPGRPAATASRSDG